MFAPAASGGAWRTMTVQSSAARGPARVLVAPGALVLARQVAAVGRTEAQARAAALAGLAHELAVPAEQCICALGPAEGGRRTAFVMARMSLDELVAGARANGFAADAATPDFMLLPQPSVNIAYVADGADARVRTAEGGFACPPDLVAVLLGDRQREHIDFDGAVAASARDGGLTAMPNLIEGSRTTQAEKRTGGWAVAAASLAAALLVFAALPWIDAYKLEAATSDMRRATDAAVRAALPPETRIVNALAQLREAHLPRAQAAESLNHATVLIEGLALSPGVAVSRIDLTDGGVHAQVNVANTALLQPLRDHIAASGLKLVEAPGLSEPNNIPVDLQVSAT